MLLLRATGSVSPDRIHGVEGLVEGPLVLTGRMR
jgi:hypothetical protein